MENRLWRYVAWTLAAIICMAIGYGFGFGYGFSQGVTFAVHVGLDFVDIDIDEARMLELVQLYQNFCHKDGVAECLENFRIGNITV